MPKLIDYPRTTYAGAWELAEVVDDTGGKCAIDTAARKLNRKVSGSFKAIIGSAVKFGLMTSKRDLLSTTTLFRRIKHAYDKQEELLFHREAFLTPPLFTQLCRKFRSRELPVQMLDVMLIREFGVEEINAQGVARAFVEGARMVGLLDEHNIVADIDQLAAKQPPRREIASPQPVLNTFRTSTPIQMDNIPDDEDSPAPRGLVASAPISSAKPAPHIAVAANDSESRTSDVVANLFGLTETNEGPRSRQPTPALAEAPPLAVNSSGTALPVHQTETPSVPASTHSRPPRPSYQLQISGPGIDTQLIIAEEDDLHLVQALLDKIRRQLKS